jgi:hypothetical protein
MTLPDIAGEQAFDIVHRAVEVSEFDGGAERADRGAHRGIDRVGGKVARHVGRNLDFSDGFGPALQRNGRARIKHGAVKQKADHRRGQPAALQRCRRAEADFPADLLRAGIELLLAQLELPAHSGRDARIIQRGAHDWCPPSGTS